MAIENIVWSSLVASTQNVRKVKSGIDTLASSIAADGLLQNLVVIPCGDNTFEVVAGERRRRAIVALVKSKVWPRDVTVPCEVRAGEATAISYAENAQRVAMHPADAIRAFAALANEGHQEEAIAHRYGYDTREVRRMLALAALSPKVLNALAADKIDVACAQAFTLTDDHHRQEQVLKRARCAHDVRRVLTDTKITTNHRLFRFVGADAYAAAGGTLTSDLFATEGEGYADAPELVEQMAEAKFATLVAEAEEAGWGEVIATVQTPYESYSWHRLTPDQEDGYSPLAMAGAVLVIVVAQDGSTAATPYTRKAKRAVSSGGGTAPLPRALYDQRMVLELSQIRTAALQAELAGNIPVAHAVLLDALLPIAMGNRTGAHALQLRGDNGIQSAAERFDLNTKEMPTAFAGVADLLVDMPDTPSARFAWIVALEAPAIARLLAACTGALVDATEGKYADPNQSRCADRIARAVGLDMRQHWEAGIEFYDRMTRKAMLSALAEARSPEAAQNCERMKKPDLALACLDRMAGTGWLPPALRTPDAPHEPDTDTAVDAANDDDHGEMLIAAE